MFTLSTKTYHRSNLRQQILAISLELIAEQGVRALTFREIAQRLDVSRMAPYRHFADKAALLAAITAAGFAEFTGVLEAAVASAGEDISEQLRAVAVAYVRFALEHRAHFEVMFGGGGEPQYLDEAGKQIAYKSFAILEGLIRLGQHQNLIIAGDSVAIAQMVWATVHGISTLRLETEAPCGTWQPDFTVFCTHLLRNGLLPRENPPQD